MSEVQTPDPITRFVRWLGTHGPMVPLLVLAAFILAVTGLDEYSPAKQLGQLILAGLLIVAAAVLASRPRA